ncbi:MAG: hypothetical protein KGY99_02775 [Phycisphaerae bacterium]|nr:hypothetical protein [Phycisphaerae bacterium]
MSTLPALELSRLPQIDLRHLFVLTDDTGILQHATHATPDLHHGYCTDDNARALIAAVKVTALPSDLWARNSGEGGFGPEDLLVVTQRYLAFLAYAFNEDAGRFRNFMQYDRTWLEDIGSEDSHARTVWALGTAVRLAPNDDVAELAERLLHKALPATEQFEHIRPQAYTLLGVDEYLRSPRGGERAQRLHAALGTRVYEPWQQHATDDWPWWEDELTWGNAKLPHALLVTSLVAARADMRDDALTALRWLLEVQTGPAGQLSIIGNRGWYRRGEQKATFDQQPIEAKGLVQACLTAASATGDSTWTEHARRCFEWFTGRNDVGAPLYNPATGGGQDGLTEHGPNANQGAESTLAYLMSVLDLHHYDRAQKGNAHLAPTGW